MANKPLLCSYVAAALKDGQVLYATGATKDSVLIQHGEKAAHWNRDEAERVIVMMAKSGYNAFLITASPDMVFENQTEREKTLLDNTVAWFLNDACETEVARTELYEIGFTDKELLMHGFPEEA